MPTLRSTLILSIAIGQLSLIWPTVTLPFPPAAAFGKKEEKQALVDKEDKTDKEDGKAKKEKKEKKEKKIVLTEEEIEEEKAYMEHQAKLSATLKETKTPFGSQGMAQPDEKPSLVAPMTLPATSLRRSGAGRSLGDRLLASRLYLPGRLVMGHPAEFTLKGRPGHWAALAMADRDSGAKPIAGHAIRLGPDRKVVALGKIPASGVITLKIYSPVAGDLVGSSLYFEAATWPENDINTVEFAQTVTSEGGTNTHSSATNAVLVAEEGDRKRGVRIVPEAAMPILQRGSAGGVGLSSGKP